MNTDSKRPEFEITVCEAAKSMPDPAVRELVDRVRQVMTGERYVFSHGHDRSLECGGYHVATRATFGSLDRTEVLMVRYQTLGGAVLVQGELTRWEVWLKGEERPRPVRARTALDAARKVEIAYCWRPGVEIDRVEG